MLTFQQALNLTRGTILYQLNEKNRDGSPRRWKVNGLVQTWKRDSTKIRVPLKHGLYSFDALTEADFDSNGYCFMFSLTEQI